MTDLKVNMKQIVNAPIEAVFDAWLDPQMLARFVLPAPGMPSPEVETDPREGGRFVIIMQVGDNKIPHAGQYLKIDRPHKLVFTWESPRSVDNSSVSLDFVAVAADQTEVELTHIMFLDEGTRADHEGGWGNILLQLSEVVGSE